MKSKNSFRRSNNPKSRDRLDEIDQYYKPIEKFDTIDGIIYWVLVILSFLVLYRSQIPIPQLQELPAVLFVVFVFVHLVLSLYIRFYLFPAAEEKRRRQLLSNAFDVPLTPERTQKYYNNKIAPSVARLGVNVLENAFFSKSVSGKMVTRERIIIFSYFIVWFFALIWRSTDLGLLTIITQTLFSSEIIEKWIRLEIFHRNSCVYFEDLYRLFLQKVDLESQGGIASVLDTLTSYETAKGMAGVRLSSSIFFSINSEGSTEWGNIQKKLGLDKYVPKKDGLSK